jgi:hypothetical protein
VNREAHINKAEICNANVVGNLNVGQNLTVEEITALGDLIVENSITLRNLPVVPSCSTIIHVPTQLPTIQDAIDEAVALGASANDPYIVAICPGIYLEDIVLQSNVHLTSNTGASFNQEESDGFVVIRGTMGDGGLPVLNTSVTNVTLQGPIVLSNAGTVFEATKCKIAADPDTGAGGVDVSGVATMRQCPGDVDFPLTHVIRPVNGGGAALRWVGPVEIGQVQAGFTGSFSPHIFQLRGSDVDGRARLDLLWVRHRGRFETVDPSMLSPGATAPANGIFIFNSSLRFPVFSPFPGAPGAPIGPYMFELHAADVPPARNADAVLIQNSSIDNTGDTGLPPGTTQPTPTIVNNNSAASVTNSVNFQAGAVSFARTFPNPTPLNGVVGFSICGAAGAGGVTGTNLLVH